MTVWIVTAGSFEDEAVWGVFSTRDKADAARQAYNAELHSTVGRIDAYFDEANEPGEYTVDPDLGAIDRGVV